jgi:hypothetical protein
LNGWGGQTITNIGNFWRLTLTNATTTTKYLVFNTSGTTNMTETLYDVWGNQRGADLGVEAAFFTVTPAAANLILGPVEP